MKELTLECPMVFNFNSEEMRSQIEKNTNAMFKAFEDIKIIAIKAWETFKLWIKENPCMIKYFLKKNKYEKRVINRNKLFIKRKKLGRKL